MKRYEKYKDSGISWIGEIPEDWHVKRFASFITLGKGLPITKADLINEGIPVISYGQIHSNDNIFTGLNESLLRYVHPDFLETNKQSLLNKYDLVFADTSEDIEGSGNFVLNDKEYKVFAGYHTIIVRLKGTKAQELSPKYLAYVLMSRAFRGQIQKRMNGVKVFSITRQIIRNTNIILPPFLEQKIIEEYLDKKIAKVDKYIQNKKKEITALDELKQSIIAETVTKGLDKNVAMKDSDIAWIGKVPEHWKIKRSAMLFQENKKKNSTLEYERAMKFNYGTLVDKNETGELKELEDTYKNYTILDKNDIVINCLNLNYDFVSQRVAISPKRSIITSAYLVLRPRKNTNAHYYNYLLKAMDSMKLFHGMGTGIRLTLSFDEFKKQLLPIPPLSEQEVIVAYINRKCEKIDKMKSSIESQITALKEYKQRLISDVVTGKRKVTSEN